MKPVVRLRLCVVVVSLFTAQLGRAADITWTNTAGGNWGDPSNWSPNFVPGPPDNAYITNAGTYFVGVDIDGTVSRLVVGGSGGLQYLTMAGASLTLRNASKIGPNGVFYWSSGTVDGAGDLLVEGTLEWLGGTMQGKGRTIIPEGHTLTISSGASKVLNRALDLRGNGVFRSTLDGGSAGEITVFPGKTLELVGAALGGSAVMNNLGTLRKTGPGTAVIGFALNNPGVVQVMEGSLSLQGGGTYSGTFDVTGGAGLDFAGGVHTLTNGVVLNATGASLIRVMDGTLSVVPDLTINTRFELRGTLTGEGDVTFNGGLNWSTGTMTGNGKTIIPSQATVMGVGGVFLRDVDLHGACSMQGNVLGGEGATFTIFPGATFDTSFLAGLNPYGNGTSAIINNLGTFRKAAGAQRAVTDIGLTFNNGGLVQLSTGSFNLVGGGASSGVFDVANGTLINFDGGVHTMNAGAGFSASGSGFYRVNSGVFRVNADLAMQPTFELRGDSILDGERNITFSNTLNWFGGTMQGSGRTIIAEGTRVAIQGNSSTKTLLRHLDLHGYGSISGTASLLGGAGADFTISPTGIFELLDDPTLASAGLGEVATLINQGVLRKPEGAGTATIGFRVANSGTVDSQSGTIRFPQGYVQHAGLTLLSGGNFSGNLLDLQGGQLTGAGTVDADLQSGADLFPGGPIGVLNISGTSPRKFTGTPAGTLNIQMGGLTAGTGHDQLRINGPASLAGILNVELSNGFVPTAGNSFTVMTYTARSGQFSGIAAPSGVFFFPVYSATTLVLNTVSENDVLTPLHQLVPSGFVGTSTNRSFQITMTGEAGRQYEIYAQTNVAAPFATWQLLGSMTPADRLFDYRDSKVDAYPGRFYRAKQVP